MAASGSNSLKEYLKRYGSNEQEEKKKNKKKKKRAKPDMKGVLVVDEDPVWQKPVNLEEEESDDSADEAKPQVEEDIEVKRMKRLEQLRLRRPYNAISEDGSGWVSLSPKHGDSTIQSSDISPPRKQRTRNDTPSPDPELKPSDSVIKDTDFSPPRERRRRHHTPSPEPYTESVKANLDLSPPRNRRVRNDTPSPEPGLKPLANSNEENDLSPPRQRHKHRHTPPETNSDLSPPRKLRVNNDKPVREDADLSPPRQHRKRHHSPSPELDKRHADSTRHNFDMSPPRRSRPELRRDFEPDLSPPRKSRFSSTYQDQTGASQGSDLSPPRKSTKDVDLSPPRKSNKKSSVLAPLSERPKTGLISGRDISEEIAKTKKDEWLRFQEMDPSMSGRGAEPVYRDKKGQRISKEEYLKSRQKVEEKPKEKKLEWGKGLAQKREAEAKLQELELEKEKPFARTRDDPELDNMLKERVRWGDPMAHLVKKKYSEPILPNLGDNDKMKESGFIVPQEIPNHSWIKRMLDAAPNRYGIRPGRHWDGVDRSNGFEKQMFKRANEKQATEKEAYLWSVADM